MNNEAMDFAAQMDAADALAQMSERFALPRGSEGNPLLYLCGHSLGLAPRGARALVDEQLDDWEQLGVLGHEGARRPWIEFADALRPGLAVLAGADSKEVVAMNSLTANLHLMLASFYRPTRERSCILIEGGAFSSDRHAVASQIAWHGYDPASSLIELRPEPGGDLIDPEQIETLLRERGEQIALVLWPGVQFRTGQAFDITRLARACRATGCTLGLDLAHAIGNVPLQLHGDEVDFAVWCSYKYLNGGPGAIGGAFVHQKHFGVDLPRLTGWWGHESTTRFAMGEQFVPGAGAAGWQLSNPSILATAPLIASLQLFISAGLPALLQKSRALTGFLAQLILQRCSDAVQIVSPLRAEARGCQLSLRINAGRNAGLRAFRQLASLGVVADWREPDIIRVAPVPLYNSFADVARYVQLLATALRA
ncbi:MAG: kynureninase [Steroidobacteraceae bacterium]